MCEGKRLKDLICIVESFLERKTPGDPISQASDPQGVDNDEQMINETSILDWQYVRVVEACRKPHLPAEAFQVLLREHLQIWDLEGYPDAFHGVVSLVNFSKATLSDALFDAVFIKTLSGSKHLELPRNCGAFFRQEVRSMKMPKLFSCQDFAREVTFYRPSQSYL